MDPRAEGNRLLAELSEALELEPLEFDENNEAALNYKGKVDLLFFLEDQRLNAIFINVPLGSAAESGGRELLMYELLSANYCWNATEGATLGIDAESGLYALSYLVELPLEDGVQFAEIVAKIINVADHWMRKIEVRNRETEDSGTPSVGKGSIRV